MSSEETKTQTPKPNIGNGYKFEMQGLEAEADPKIFPHKKRPQEKKPIETSDLVLGRSPGGNSVMKQCREIFQQRVENHEVDRLINPFSEFWGRDKNDYLDKLENAKAVWKGADKRTRLTKADDKYGRPVDGTLTAYRGNKAKNFIANNIIECCETVQNVGYKTEDGNYECKFGVLFKTYERINDKLVGLLVRARRHGLIDFPGEMLYQRQDDDVIVKLIKIPTFEELNLKYMEFKAEAEAEKEERDDEPTVQ